MSDSVKDQEKGGYDPDNYPTPKYSLEEIAPDFVYWLRKDVWNINEAVYLILNIDPQKSPYIGRHNDLLERFVEIGEIARIAEGRSLIYETPSIVIDEEFGEKKAGMVNPRSFINWAYDKGYEIPEQFLHLIENSDSNKSDANGEQYTHLETNRLKNKIGQRVADISLLANFMFDDPMCIPVGGKSKLKKCLCELKPSLFTMATFDSAWKKAKKDELIEIENVEQYK